MVNSVRKRQAMRVDQGGGMKKYGAPDKIGKTLHSFILIPRIKAGCRCNTVKPYQQQNSSM
tara:strand:+ start:676 stop:858 length:183 start_codon:yes stop_codon:yes gene_type:complete